MIIRSRCPLRISFAGGGTELSPYVDEHGGLVLSATISLYAYCNIKLRNDDVYEFIACESEESQKFFCVNDILPNDNFPHLKIVCACVNYLTENLGKKLPGGFTAWTYADAPVGSGLGTSSTLTVAILSSLFNLLKERISNYEIAKIAHIIERQKLGLAGGMQDHYSAAFGGVNLMEFKVNREVMITPIRLPQHTIDELEASTLMYYTGKSRESGNIISNQVSEMASGEISKHKYDRIKQFTNQALERLLFDDIPGLGQILHESWQHKRSLASSITTPFIDEIYDECMTEGCYGGKISGAGGGGFMLLLMDPLKRQSIENLLKERPGFTFKPSITNNGASTWQTDI